MFWILLGSLLAAQPAPSPPSASASAVLVLNDGSVLLVNSWQVEGRMVRIVGSKGEALTLQIDQLDLPASRHAMLYGHMAKADKPITCRSEYRAEQLAEASRKARAAGLNGGLVQLTAGEQRPWLGSPTRRVSAAGEGPHSLWVERFGSLRSEYRDTRREQAELSRRRAAVLPLEQVIGMELGTCLLYTSPSPRDRS